MPTPVAPQTQSQSVQQKPFRVAKYRTLPYEALPIPPLPPKNPKFADVKARVVSHR